MSLTRPDDGAWRKSTRSGTTECVEVALLDGAIFVRDSKDSRGPQLQFSRHSWSKFIAQLGTEVGEPFAIHPKS